MSPHSKETLELISEIPSSIAHLNPEIAIIGAISLLILFLRPFVKNKVVQAIPGPMLVLLVATPLGMYFDVNHQHLYRWAGHDFPIGPQYLVHLPGSLIGAMAFPDFSQVFSSLAKVHQFQIVDGKCESATVVPTLCAAPNPSQFLPPVVKLVPAHPRVRIAPAV